MAKQRTIKLNLNNTYDEQTLKVEGDRVKPSKGEKVQFEPICIFTENKPRRAFLRSPKKLMFYVDGMTHALKFGQSTQELQTHWSKKEAEEFVKKAIAEAHAKFTPIKTWQFIVILILLFVSLFFLWRIAGTTGALR